MEQHDQQQLRQIHDVESKGFKYDGVTTVNGAPFYDTSTSLYVYYIDGEAMINDYSIPSMSEGLCTIGDRVYVLFESGANKYKHFVRQSLKNVLQLYSEKER